MSSIAKRIAGLLAILVAVVGVGLAGYGIIQARAIAGRAQREIPDVIRQLVEIAHVVERQGDALVGSLGLAREHADSLLATVELLANQPGTRPAAVAEQLEAELRLRLEGAEEFVVSLQGTMRSMSGTLLALDSLPFLAPRTEQRDGHSQLRTMAVNLTDTADQLERVARDLSHIRSGGPLDTRELEVFRDTVQRADDELAVAQGEVKSFVDRLVRATETIESWGEGIEPAVDRTAWLAVVFLACFAATQLALGVCGFLLVRGPREPRESEK